MRFTLFVLFCISCVCSTQAQVKDSSDYKRVEMKVVILMDHFNEHVSQDSSLNDTISYIQYVFANHIETIKKRTDLQRNRKPMYEYAVRLRTQKLQSILSPELYERYLNSFEFKTSGMTYCRVCEMSRFEEKTHCPNCGEGY